MNTSQNGKLFIKGNEGLALLVYDDNGKQAIGIGHDLEPGESFLTGITEEQAWAILDQDLATRFEPAVNRLAPGVNQNQFDALIDFCFNLGPGALATMLHHGIDQAPVQMLAWCYEQEGGVEQKSPALEARRAKEVELFNS